MLGSYPEFHSIFSIRLTHWVVWENNRASSTRFSSISGGPRLVIGGGALTNRALVENALFRKPASKLSWSVTDSYLIFRENGSTDFKFLKICVQATSCCCVLRVWAATNHISVRIPLISYFDAVFQEILWQILIQFSGKTAQPILNSWKYGFKQHLLAVF